MKNSWLLLSKRVAGGNPFLIYRASELIRITLSEVSVLKMPNRENQVMILGY
jgi:hypothetical protein